MPVLLRQKDIRSVALVLSLLVCLIPVVKATPQLSVQQLGSFQALCSGTASGLPLSLDQDGLMLFNASGHVDEFHSQLAQDIAATSFQGTGLLLCMTHQQTEISTCDFFLFTIPRIRQDIAVRLISVRSPEQTIASALLPGNDPVSCNDAGDVDGSTESILGNLPLQAVIDFIDSEGIDAGDADADKLSNIAELIAGTAPLISNASDVRALVTANSRAAGDMLEGEDVQLRLDFKPGSYQGMRADFYLTLESELGNYSYFHPSGFFPSEGETIAVSARAPTLNSYKVARFSNLEVGEYRVTFKIIFSDNSVHNSVAEFQIVKPQWQFVDVSDVAGITHEHGYAGFSTSQGLDREAMQFSGGVAAGDFDKDGWVDLYIPRGSIGYNLLLKNKGDGSFTDVATEAGVRLGASSGSTTNFAFINNSSATFADVDGDGWLDLFVSGILDTRKTILFRNDGDGTFTDISAQTKLPSMVQSLGSSFADYDKDGDLDFWVTHWREYNQAKYLFRQNDDGSFTDVSFAAGVIVPGIHDFAANFVDINSDGWPDILVAADYGTSQVFLSDQDGTFTNATTSVISDKNGMGSAVGDYDNDGDLDWFVSAISALPGVTEALDGNRLYNNQGDGSFQDYTSLTGTRDGGWGWGSCFADFNNDGYLDLYHVNGYYRVGNPEYQVYEDDKSLLFVNDQFGKFNNEAAAVGLDNDGQGRGIVCFDYDRDGDIDIFVVNNHQRARLYENRGLSNHWLHVRLAGEEKNSEAVGARVYITAAGITQMRELRVGSNYLSQNPVIAYFGLGSTDQVDEVRVIWPSGDERVLTDISADQMLFIEK